MLKGRLARGVRRKASGLMLNCCMLSRIILTVKRTRFFISLCACLTKETEIFRDLRALFLQLP